MLRIIESEIVRQLGMGQVGANRVGFGTGVTLNNPASNVAGFDHAERSAWQREAIAAHGECESRRFGG